MDIGSRKKIIVISDTHIGSCKENLDYIRYLYEFAKINSIDVIVHGGDLLDGFMDEVNCSSSKLDNQARYLLNNYPYDKYIKNYILYGNHDFKFIRLGYDLTSVLNERDDLIHIGTRKGLIVINNENFIIKHKIKKCRPRDITDAIGVVNFIGHSHKYKIENEKSIYIPTLSDDLMGFKNNKPGYLVVELNDDTIITNHYVFNKDVYKENEYVFVK